MKNKCEKGFRPKVKEEYCRLVFQITVDSSTPQTKWQKDFICQSRSNKVTKEDFSCKIKTKRNKTKTKNLINHPKTTPLTTLETSILVLDCIFNSNLLFSFTSRQCGCQTVFHFQAEAGTWRGTRWSMEVGAWLPGGGGRGG